MQDKLKKPIDIEKHSSLIIDQDINNKNNIEQPKMNKSKSQTKNRKVILSRIIGYSNFLEK